MSNNIRRGPTVSRSFRFSEENWKLAKERADEEGVFLNYVVEVLLSGYAHNHIDLPKVITKFD